MIAVTGATGQLGRLVIKHLLQRTTPDRIVALVRNLEKAEMFKELGIGIRYVDYSKPETLKSALSGNITKLLLISSSEVGLRFLQHKNVIDAAKQSSIKLIAYTSILKADTSPFSLAEEHLETEEYLRSTNIPHVLLRNGWYTENYLLRIKSSMENGALIGCAKDGKISSSACDDYAEAAAVILTSDKSQNNKVYELSGDETYSLSSLCEIISQESGKTIPYIDMEESDFIEALKGSGVPAPLADILACSDIGACKGGLLDESHTLSTLIGRPTTSLRQLVRGYL